MYEKDMKESRRRFLLIIVLAVAAINALWLVSYLFNRRSPEPQPRLEQPDSLLGRSEYEINQAEAFLEENRREKAAEYANRVETCLKTLDNETLTPAQRLLLKELQNKLSVLELQLEKRTKGALGGPDLQ